MFSGTIEGNINIRTKSHQCKKQPLRTLAEGEKKKGSKDGGGPVYNLEEWLMNVTKPRRVYSFPKIRWHYTFKQTIENLHNGLPAYSKMDKSPCESSEGGDEWPPSNKREFQERWGRLFSVYFQSSNEAVQEKRANWQGYKLLISNKNSLCFNLLLFYFKESTSRLSVFVFLGYLFMKKITEYLKCNT